MSQPNLKAELHEAVEDYCQNWIAEPIEIPYLHEEIDHPEKRTKRFDEFIGFLEG